jgi:hypothetical protein
MFVIVKNQPHLIRFIAKVFAFSTILFIAGCGKNPLLGEWVSTDTSPFGCSLIRFTADREFCDSMSNEVSYEVSESSVLVKSVHQSELLPFDISYSIISNDVFSYTTPFHKEMVYLYRKGTPAISKEVIEYSKKYSLEELRQSCDSGPVKVTHPSKYWSETMPKKIHEDVCLALKLKMDA